MTKTRNACFVGLSTILQHFSVNDCLSFYPFEGFSTLRFRSSRQARKVALSLLESSSRVLHLEFRDSANVDKSWVKALTVVWMGNHIDVGVEVLIS